MNKIIYTKYTPLSILERLDIDLIGDCKIGENVEIYRGTIIKNSSIGDGCVLKGSSIIENSTISANVEIFSSNIFDSEIDSETKVGPFAHIRNNSKIGKNCRVGNFVEIKNSIIGNETKMAHLTYVGDAEIGENCNVGCGVIFCNYNGEIKQKSIVGNKVFIGSNTNIIAPVNIGDEVYIAAGSTINKNLQKAEFAIARSRQSSREDFDNPYLRKLNKK